MVLVSGRMWPGTFKCSICKFGFHSSSEFGVVPTHAICAVEHRQYIALDHLDIQFSSSFMG